MTHLLPGEVNVMRRVIFTQKGGVGKSSITCNLAAISAARGVRTLVVDLDPQGNASEYLLARPVDGLSDTAEQLFEQALSLNFLTKRDPSGFVHRSPFEHLAVLPAGPGLDLLGARLEARQKVYKLRDALQILSHDFERIYVDTAPAINFFTRSALIAAERCLIPFDCDSFARQSLYGVLETVGELREDHNPNLAVEGIVINQYQAQANLPRQLVEELRGEGLPVLSTMLPSSVKLRESHQAHTPLIHLAPKHKLTLAMVALHDALERSRAEAVARSAVAE